MNALMISNDTPEGNVMSSSESANERQQTGELRSDIRHLQSDVTELKTEVRVVNQRIDSLRSELTGKIDGIRDSLASAKVWALVLYAGLAGAMFYAMARGFKWL